MRKHLQLILFIPLLGLVALIVSGQVTWMLVGAVVVLATLPIYFPKVGAAKKSQSRAETEAWMRKEGYLPKTREEVAEDAELERIANIRFRDPPEDTYYDSQWHLRDIHTDRLI
jgi:hypothetical protein